MNSLMTDIGQSLRRSKQVLLATHFDPDGDCLGSTLALALALRGLGKKVSLACADKLPPLYRFLPQPGLWRTRVPQAAFDLTLTVDCANPDRLGRLRDQVLKTKKIVNIDHHGDNTRFGRLNYVRPAAAAGLHVYRILKAAQIKITPEIAAALYVAILTDTGGFRFANTDAEVLRVCSELTRLGAEPGRLAGLIYENFPPSQVQMAGLIYGRLRTLAGGKIACSWLTRQDQARLKISPAELGNPVDYLRILGGVEVVLFFREAEEGLVKVNFRSKGKVNVRPLAQKWGGGGHRAAAGATIKGRLDPIRAAILKEVKSLVGKPTKASRAR